MPRRSCRSTAAIVGAGPWPAIAPVSPRHRSMYSWPSTQVTCAPSADSTYGGNGPAHLIIQGIGTPSRSEAFAVSWSAAERGWAVAKRCCSTAISRSRRSRSSRVLAITRSGCRAHGRGVRSSRVAPPRTRQRRPGRRAGVVPLGRCGRAGASGQLTRRTNPQMLQVAVPVRGSISRKLGHPLVPQKSLELTAAAVDRRRIRRIAEARPVTDDVVERVIMVNGDLCFLVRRHRDMSDRLRVLGSVPNLQLGWERRL